MSIVLPKKRDDGRGSFSYSQYSKWKTSKKDYIISYFLGERFEGNAYTEFGSLVGEALETGDFSAFTEEEKEFLSTVTRLDEFERKIEYDFGDFVVLGFIDTNDNKDGIVENIVDYKTGASNKVEVYEDESYDQVTIYAGAIKQETGHLPKNGWVELIERTGNPFRGESLKLGTRLFTIKQDVSEEAVEKMEANILKVAKDISAHYKVFNKLNSIKV